MPPAHSGRGGDLFIIVLGTTGVGKSNFINVAVGKEVAPVFHSLDPGTRAVKKYVVREGQPRIILVDTPGFGSSDFVSDRHILQDVLRWTEKNCSPTTAFGSIIYLRTFPPKTEPLLRELEGTQAISQVLKSAMVYHAIRKDRPKPNDNGMTSDRFHFDNTTDSAWNIINSIASNPNPPRLSTVRDELKVLAWGRPAQLEKKNALG